MYSICEVPLCVVTFDDANNDLNEANNNLNTDEDEEINQTEMTCFKVWHNSVDLKESHARQHSLVTKSKGNKRLRMNDVELDFEDAEIDPM